MGCAYQRANLKRSLAFQGGHGHVLSCTPRSTQLLFHGACGWVMLESKILSIPQKWPKAECQNM